MDVQSLLLDSPYWIRQLAINTYGYKLYRRRFSGGFKSYLAKYQDNLSKTPEQIEREQFHLLKKNLIYCKEHIPYYRRIFTESGFDPYGMTAVNDIQKIPFLTKEIIRKEFDELYNKEIPKSKYVEHFTSGSTGEKLKFFLPKELVNKKNMAFLYRFYGMAGVRPREKRVTIGGRRFTNKKPYYAYNYFENQLLLSSHHLFDDVIPSYISEMTRFNPVFIQGHPSAILILAKYLLNRGFKADFTLKAIFTTGETLLNDDKIIIEKAFKTNVFQQYGSGENCFSAQEAPGEEGYLLNYENGYVEMVGDNEYKEVFVTSLQNEVMPFVRYKIGDFVLPKTKTFSKQFGLPILFKEVIGRTDDVLENSRGQKVLPVTIRMNMKPFLTTGANYQIIQKGTNVFQLSLLDNNKKVNKEKVIQMLKKILGNDAQIHVYYVSSLTSLGGKIRNVIREYENKI